MAGLNKGELHFNILQSGLIILCYRVQTALVNRFP